MSRVFNSRRIFSVVITVIALSVLSCAHSPAVKDALTAKEHFDLATVYESRGERRNALKQYRKAIASDRSNPEVYFAYANLSLKEGLLDAALEAYKTAIWLRPKSGIYRNNLGWLYMRQGRYKKAAGAAGQAAALDPQRAYIYLDTLGVILTRQKRYPFALVNFKKAVASVPANRPTVLKRFTDTWLTFTNCREIGMPRPNC